MLGRIIAAREGKEEEKDKDILLSRKPAKYINRGPNKGKGRRK